MGLSVCPDCSGKGVVLVPIYSTDDPDDGCVEMVEARICDCITEPKDEETS
jgi:RecJ-like exonuclease